MKHSIALNKITQISLTLKVVGNIWDYVNSQFDKMHDKDMVIFRHFIAEMLDIIHIQYSTSKSIFNTNYRR